MKAGKILSGRRVRQASRPGLRRFVLHDVLRHPLSSGGAREFMEYRAEREAKEDILGQMRYRSLLAIFGGGRSFSAAHRIGTIQIFELRCVKDNHRTGRHGQRRRRHDDNAQAAYHSRQGNDGDDDKKHLNRNFHQYYSQLERDHLARKLAQKYCYIVKLFRGIEANRRTCKRTRSLLLC